MQPRNWNDLRYLLAIWHGQTLSAAARRLRVDDTTVSRRLAALESDIGAKLVQRQADGRLVLTDVGERVAREAEAMERHFQSVAAIVGSEGDPCGGTVRVTAVPILANRLFAGTVGHLLHEHPGLVVELVANSRDYSLTKREADIAVRLARPTTGGLNVKARRIAMLSYAAYIPASTPPRDARQLDWITYDEAMAQLPQAKWIAGTAKRGGNGVSGLRVHDAETALEATAAGLGKTLLPTLVADRDPRLRRLHYKERRALPSREIWLLTHADQQTLGRTQVTTAWIEATVAAAGRRAP